MGLNISHPQIGVDPYFLAKDALKKDRVNLDDEKENTTSSLRNFTFSDFNTPHQKRQLADRQFRVERSIFILEQHIEKKVMSIFFQAIVCFLTKNVFREGHTIHQGYTAKSLHGVKFQAAHSATLPCLFAKQGDTEIVYLYRSGYYDESNATLDVIKAINDADRSIEEKTKDSLLRQKAIALLNLTSVGKITPEEVVTHFVNHLIEEIDKALTREIQSAKGEIDVAKRERILEIIDVLHFYRKKAASLIPFVNQPENIDLWLNLNMKDPLFEEASQMIVQIKDNHAVDRNQTALLIKKKIEEIPVIIRHERHKSYNESRIPNHFYDLYYNAVLNRFTGKDLIVVEEATGIKQSELNDKVTHFKRIAVTQSILTENLKKIDGLIQTVFPLIYRLQGRELLENQRIELSSQKMACLRPAIYKLRYKIIRIDQEVQSVIKVVLENTFNSIKKNLKLNNLKSFFYHMIFEQLNNSMRTFFCKLLNISSFQTNRKVRELKVNQRAHSSLEGIASAINQLSNQIHQAAINPTSKYEDLQKKISAQLPSRKSYKILFLKRLFEQAQSQIDKNLIAKLSGNTEDQINSQIDATIANKYKKTLSIDQKINRHHAKLIDDALNVAKREIVKLQKETEKFQGQLMMELRTSHGMTQKIFQSLYKKKNPGYPMSDGTLSNLENGIKTMSRETIRQVSEIFGVSEALFYPSHFAEV
ncbi:putative uncharacterized protein [Parachlamydia acanthamoebae UV-7]|jgi:hypothetical protein|uniref:HTH cro/C1-type domain-containing protein n=2 Tax=Parachlamydia acanthamoebae TaxID=83552 RepID=F8KZJ5_PARAV|nr:helix-turn-helix transcriptional regulator [Parachlamydia acanthamoebae]EFB41777.1 hypothetical protein pah_c022o055 [Parachlamydia acanthamoebae str. Hall's coccus]CCB86335.1 putative uncharacterized protein [Parachlamydia acanthamoebae UV-7]